MEKKIVGENVFRLGKKTSSTIKLTQAIEILKPTKENACRKLCFAFLEIVLAFLLSIGSETVVLCTTILEMLNGVIIAFFAVVFTGYALFQALIGDRLLVYLVNETIEDNGDEKSQLENSNDYFAKVMLIQFIAIMLNLFCIILLTVISGLEVMYRLESIERIAISSIGIFILFHLNFEVLWEIKSFIFNVFQLFNVHAFARIIEMIEKNE